MHARLASGAAALAILAILLIRSAIGPIGARAMGPLPACRYADLLTSPRGYDDWSTTLVDPILSVPTGYAPPDLVSVAEAGLAGDGRVRAVVIDDLRAMRGAAAAAKAPFGVESAYRSYAEQQQVFDTAVKQIGYDQAIKTLARPGHSEHQLGVAIDFRSDAPGAAGSGNFGSSAAGKWMSIHAWEYGFVLSYPKNLTGLTCYSAEPWHFRYVGRELAASIHASGLTLRAYLWAHFTTTVVPQPGATFGPGTVPPPTASPASSADAPPDPSPAPEPSPSATASSPTPTGNPASIPSDPISPAVAAGALPGLVAVAALAFGLIIGGAWLAARRRRPGLDP